MMSDQPIKENPKGKREAKKDLTPVTLVANAHVPIAQFNKVGVKFSEAQLQEFAHYKGGVYVARGQKITIERYIADELMKIQTRSLKSSNPYLPKQTIPAFEIAKGF